MCRSRHFDSAAIEAEGGRSSLSLNLARGQREDIALLLAIVAALLSRYFIRGSFDFHQYRHAVILPIYTEPYSKRRFLPGQNLVRAICPGWLHLTHGRSHSEMPMLLTAELCGLYCSLYVVTYIYFRRNRHFCHGTKGERHCHHWFRLSPSLLGQMITKTVDGSERLTRAK